jgi:hypothetical protein
VSEHASPQPPEASAGSKTAGAPYEAALNAAFEKLTDQILVFLLAYVLLLIGISVFASGIANELRILLYIIPILGVAAYAWTRRRGLSRQARSHDVRVTSGIARGAGTYVGGERGVVNRGAGRTTTGSLIATGGASVVGRDATTYTDKQTQQTAAAQYLAQIFQKLDERNQGKLVSAAQTLLDQQRDSNG